MQNMGYTFNDENMHMALGLQEKELWVCEGDANLVLQKWKGFYIGDELELNLEKPIMLFSLFSGGQWGVEGRRMIEAEERVPEAEGTTLTKA